MDFRRGKARTLQSTYRHIITTIALLAAALLLAGCAANKGMKKLPDTGKPDEFRERMLKTMQPAPNMLTSEAFGVERDYQTAYGMARGAAIKSIGVEAKHHMELVADTLQKQLEEGLGAPLDVEQRGLLQVEAVGVQVKDFEVLEQDMITHKNRFHVFVRIGLGVDVLYRQMLDVLEQNPDLYRQLERLPIYNKLMNGERIVLEKNYSAPLPAGKNANMDLPGN
jgi:hypothetical protein